MQTINHVAIERYARELRAREIQRYRGLFSQRAGLYVSLLGGSLLTAVAAVSNVLRPLFAWNPTGRPKASRPG